MQRKVMIAVLSYTGRPTGETMSAVVDGMCNAQARGYLAVLARYEGDARIIQVRNRVVADFHHSGFSDLIMLDDDVGAEHGAIGRLLEHPVELVAGAYPSRFDGKSFPLRWLSDPHGKTYLHEDGATGLFEVAGAPTGFMRITRACAERMIGHYTDGRYATPQVDGGVVYRLFDDGPWTEGDLGEDYQFCKRFRAIGGRVWIDAALELTHTGPQKFTGSFKSWLERQPPGEIQRIKQAA